MAHTHTEQSGYDTIVYVGDVVLAAGTAPLAVTWDEIDLAKDISEPDERNKIEWENRQGWQIGSVGSRRYAIEFEATYDSDDSAMASLEAAYIAGTVISMAVMDGNIVTEGSKGMCANVKVVTFAKSNPMAGDRSVSVTVVLDGTDHQCQVYERAA